MTTTYNWGPNDLLEAMRLSGFVAATLNDAHDVLSHLSLCVSTNPAPASPDQANTTVSDEPANIADRILRVVRSLIAEEHKHSRLLENPETELATSRDQVDLAHSRLVGFAISEVDQALRVVKRRRAIADVTEAARLLKVYDEAVEWHSYRPHDVNREADQHKAAAKLADAVRTLLAALNPPMGR